MINADNYLRIDPFILLSAINMQLRDNYSSLEDLCKSLDLDEEKLTERLQNAGFSYISEQNQFK